MKYPGPDSSACVKYLLKARADPTNTLLEIGERYGTLAHVKVGSRHVFFISGASGVEHVLHTHQNNYRGFQYSHKQLRPLLGNGLLTSAGEIWLRHRRLAQKAFHQERLEALSVAMVETIQKYLVRWENPIPPANVLDMRAEMTLLTLSVVTTSLFGEHLGERAIIVKEAFPRVMRYLLGRMFNPLCAPEWLPTKENRAYKDALKSLNTIVHELISHHRQQSVNNADLLGMLIVAHDNSADLQLNDVELRDEVMTLLLAGHETCANALTWTFYLLALYPDVQERLANEVQDILQNRTPSLENNRYLPYAAMVFNEALRLYPPAWIMARDVIDDDVIDGWPIPAGSVVFLSPFVTHRLSTLWQDPQYFDPTRFSPERAKAYPNFAYFPFGGGQRQCLGRNFALIEALFVLQLSIQRFKFSIHNANPDDHDAPALIVPDISMRPAIPMLLQIEKR